MEKKSYAKNGFPKGYFENPLGFSKSPTGIIFHVG